MTDHFRYDLLTQQALRGVVRNVLTDAAKKNGLPGDHHFYISFDTTRRGRADVGPAARAVSRADDHHPAAPVLGSDRERARLRGRPVVRRHSGKARHSVRGGQRLLRSVGAVRPAIRGSHRGRGTATAGQCAGQASQEEARHRRLCPPSRAASKPPAAPPTAAAPAEPKPDKPASGGEVVRLDRFRKKK